MRIQKPSIERDRQCIDQKKKTKRQINNIESITQKTKYRATRTPLKLTMNASAPDEKQLILVAFVVLLSLHNR